MTSHRRDGFLVLTKNRKGGLAADFLLSRLIVRLENARSYSPAAGAVCLKR